ncbi:MAG: queuosine precursor transporter [Dehalococcoidales bacterium]
MNTSYRFVIISAVFVTALITANVMSVKVIELGSLIMPAAVIIFPLSYIFGDILTEVYGYRWARRVIWLGFGCNLIFVLFTYLGQLMPAASFWTDQQAYESILGYVPRLLLASLCGYLVGEFINSFIMAKMKVATKGRWLWARTIGSTVFGEGLDTAIFVIIAYIGTASFVPIMILYHWLIKVGIEVLATPLTYKAVNYLKRTENVDVFDENTNFNPFKF